MPWADLVLFTVVASLIAIWWISPSSGSTGQRLAFFGTATATPTRLQRPPTATPTRTPTPAPPTATPTVAATATPAPAPTAIEHTVKSGETVDVIAAKYSVESKDIIEANGLSAYGFIREGQVLKIPPSKSAVPPTATPTPTPTGGALIYRVQDGDTIASIAEKLHSQVDWILQANKLTESSLLQIGQALTIPLDSRLPEPSPTATGTPKPPTATPSHNLRTPVLLSPPDGYVHAGTEEPLLNWMAVGLLADDEWYVVTVTVENVDIVIPPHWTRATSWRLPIDAHLPAGAGTELTWQVQVMSGQPGSAGTPLTEPSAPRHLIWR